MNSPIHARYKDIYKRICGNCGLTFGAHRGEDDLCPEHEGHMDWPTSGLTTFVDSGHVGDVELGTASKRGSHE